MPSVTRCGAALSLYSEAAGGVLSTGKKINRAANPGNHRVVVPSGHCSTERTLILSTVEDNAKAVGLSHVFPEMFHSA